MRPRRYFRYVEKPEHEVSVLYMVLHILIFLLTALNSLMATYAIGDIYDIFNYRCILYATPDFKVMPYVVLEDNTTVAITAATTTTEEDFQDVAGEQKIFIIEDEFHFHNANFKGTVLMTMRGSAFASAIMCDCAMFVSMISIVVSSAFAFLVFLCGRGGMAHGSEIVNASWMYVYPLLMVSVFMTILSMVFANIINEGLERFCAHFEPFSGVGRCSYHMDYFTKQQMAGKRHLWRDMVQAHLGFTFNGALWIAQSVLTSFRVLTAADFQLEVTVIKNKHDEDEEEDEEPQWEFKHFKLYETVMQVKNLRGIRSSQSLL